MAPRPPSKYDFSMAPLPRAVYFALRDFQTRHPDVDRWTCVVAAICLMMEWEAKDPDKVTTTLQSVKTTY